MKFNKKVIKLITMHYIKYDKDNPYIFVSMLLSLLGISVGLMALIITLAVINGVQKAFTHNLQIEKYPLTISSKEGYINDSLLQMLKQRFPDCKFSPYYSSSTIIKHNQVISGALVLAVDYNSESILNEAFKNARGEINSKFKIIINENLAYKLNIFKNEKVTLYFSAQEAIGFGSMPLHKRFIIDGIFKSKKQSLENIKVYITLEAFEKIFKRKHANYDGIHIYSEKPLEKIKSIKKVLPNNISIQGWWEKHESLFSAMKIEKLSTNIILILIVFISSLSIISSLFMLIMNKRSEIALMYTLGVTKKEIKLIFLKIGMGIGSIGISLGILLSVICIWILKKFDIISMPKGIYSESDKLIIEQLELSTYVFLALGVYLLIFIISLYPAKKAANTDPLIILKNEN